MKIAVGLDLIKTEFCLRIKIELKMAGLRVARLRLNDGAKLWVSFKLCFMAKI